AHRAFDRVGFEVGRDVEPGRVPARARVAVAGRESVGGFQAERAAGAGEQVGKEGQQRHRRRTFCDANGKAMPISVAEVETERGGRSRRTARPRGNENEKPGAQAKRPPRKSSTAWISSACVFITNGPYCAIGSLK